jgi:hypothetical protein
MSGKVKPVHEPARMSLSSPYLCVIDGHEWPCPVELRRRAAIVPPVTFRIAGES